MNTFKKKQHKLISLIKYSNYIFNSFPKGLISFTFDDFHISASRFGMSTLIDHHIKGTFYTSLNLKNKKKDGCSFFTMNDLDNVVTQGNEIGCHTYNHLNAYDVDSNTYIQDTLKNIDSLMNLYPKIDISSFAYPFGNVTPSIKKELSHIFSSCRGVDHPGIFISSYFAMDLFYIIPLPLYSNRISVNYIFSKIDDCVKNNKWIVFYTHDISSNHSPFGCSEYFFADIVKYAVDSGAHITTVGNAVKTIINRKS